jgi:hypothetical protein
MKYENTLVWVSLEIALWQSNAMPCLVELMQFRGSFNSLHGNLLVLLLSEHLVNLLAFASWINLSAFECCTRAFFVQGCCLTFLNFVVAFLF